MTGESFELPSGLSKRRKQFGAVPPPTPNTDSGKLETLEQRHTREQITDSEKLEEIVFLLKKISSTSTTVNLDNLINLLTNIEVILEEIKVSIEVAFPSASARTLYYDVASSNSTAVTTPLQLNDAQYTTEQVYEHIKQNAPRITACNDGPGMWYIRISHDGEQYSDEFPIYEGEYKIIYNIYEIKHRSTVAGMKYRITEFELGREKTTYFKSGRGYLRNMTVATGNAVPTVAYTTTNLHDVTTVLGQNSTTGYLKNLDALNTIFFWISHDGTEFGQGGAGLGVEYGRINPNGMTNFDYLDIHSIRVGADVNNVDYELFLG